MPSVSEFFGIAIYMYYNDHVPRHFHAEYAEHEASIAIESLAVLSGALPGRALGIVRDWARVRPDELRENWSLARRGLTLKPIPPLE